VSELYQQVVLGQFEAALAMLKQCLERCPAELWESKIAQLSVRQIAYHTLFFVDYYLDSEAAFTLRELHHTGGDEREPINSPGLEQAATLAYVAVCHEKLRMTLSNETETTLLAPSGFSWLPFSRAELHLYNTRHVQHHTGQISAHLRRLDERFHDHRALPWIRTGWR
jgi:uncharacterized damage-inducible protein DinB